MAEAKREGITRLLKRGLNHYGLGDLEAAIACWERVRQLDPGNRAAHDYLETAYEEAGLEDKDRTVASGPIAPPRSPRRAASTEDDATPRTPTPPGARADALPDDASDVRIASALEAYKSGRLDEAWADLQSAAEAQPDRLDLQGYLAMVRSERARKWAREIGDQGRALRLTRTMQEIMRMNLKPDEGFLLARLQEGLSIEEVLNLSADRVRSLEIIHKLIREGVVE